MRKEETILHGIRKEFFTTYDVRKMEEIEFGAFLSANTRQEFSEKVYEEMSPKDQILMWSLREKPISTE